VIRLRLQAFSPLATIGVNAVRAERHVEVAPLVVMNLTARPGEHSMFVVVAVEDREHACRALASFVGSGAHVLVEPKSFQRGNSIPSTA
jgi:hypothetical protein